MAAFSLGGSHATRLFFGFPLVQQRERRQLIPLTLEGLNAFRRRLLERANIPIPQTGLIRRTYIEAMAGYPQDARVDEETQGTGESAILKPAFLSHGRTPRHAETGRSTSGSTTNGTDTAVQAGNGRSRFFLSTSLLERRWIVRNLFQRAGNAVRNVAGRIRSAFSRGGSRSSGS